MKIIRNVIIVLLAFISLTGKAELESELPFIQKKEGFSQLIVNGQPYIMLAGELHNSSASNLKYLEPIWDKLAAMHLNTVIATVSWELFEPGEGQYDYSLVDGIIQGAREHQLKLVLIWFGTWKNSWSTYVPEWVKTDLKRFPRMQTKSGENSGALSAFGENTLKADSQAFAQLMKHIRETDRKEQTVLMMQVENETGVLNTTRDLSPLAEKWINQQVPSELINYLKINSVNLMPEMKAILKSTGKLNGTWKEIFGASADEVFQAWYTASFVGKVTASGKDEYNIPMYVNAWLDGSFSTSVKPEYPCGGPISKMMDIWRAAAPKIDLFAPDIYLDDFKRVCAFYTQSGNPLFIPEAQRDARAASNVYYALGQHNAICFAPFGIDGTITSNLADVYGSLSGFLPFFANHQGIGNNRGLLYSGNVEEIVELGGYKIKITYFQKRDAEKDIPESAGIILMTAPGEFYIGGFGLRVDFRTTDGKGWVETLMHEQGTFQNGIWISERRMNGDELDLVLSAKPEFRKIKVHIVN
jgi:hypothetical protein